VLGRARVGGTALVAPSFNLETILPGISKIIYWMQRPPWWTTTLIVGSITLLIIVFVGLPDDVTQKNDAFLSSPLRKYNPASFPVAVVAHIRPALLKRCIESLLDVQGVDKSMITVFQDGHMEEVALVAKSFGLRVVQHRQGNYPPGTPGHVYISDHYGFLLREVFNLFPRADYAVIVEDDMVFSYDFLDYFAQLAPLLDIDPSIWSVSSFNDNGFLGMASSLTNVMRCDFFVGLGWLAPRRIFVDELLPIWPEREWDMWIQEDYIRKGRETIFPEVSRNYNLGVVGVHSNVALFEKYFKDIAFYQEKELVQLDTSRALHYEKVIWDEIGKSQVWTELPDVIAQDTPQLVSIIFRSSGPEDFDRWKHVADCFNLWNYKPIRDLYKGILVAKFGKIQFFLIASWSPFVKAISFRQMPLPLLSGGAMDSEAFDTQHCPARSSGDPKLRFTIPNL
jgi:hypothetical protein